MNDLKIGPGPSSIPSLPLRAGQRVAWPFNEARTEAVQHAIDNHRAIEARLATWAERYAQWREAQKLLELLEKRGFGANEELEARVEQLRIESQTALEAVQLRLGADRGNVSPAADS